jgi:hypothetical protein
MPAAVAIPALIAGGSAIGTAASGIVGANKQAGTTEEALADARAQRAWQQQQYQDYLTRLKPYQGYGQQAGGQLSTLLSQGNPFAMNAQQVQIPASTPKIAGQ